MNTRMDRSRLNIGAYILQPYARTEEHIRGIKEAGLDFIVSMEPVPETLDLFSKYGIGLASAFGVIPGWWGGNGDKAGQMAESLPLEKYVEAAKKFEDHPAVWGIDMGDEPSALDFDHFGKVTNCVQTIFPRQFGYLNLYPNYASVAQNTAQQTVNQLGTATYAEHIEEYCKKVPLDYISFDFYPYALRDTVRGISGCLENFRVVADAARRYGKSLWYVPQVNSSKPEEWISENRLRFQAFTAMAFGAESIIWACYTAGWWHNQVLDANGEKTEQYEKLKTVNKEIATLGVPYMKYRNTYTHFVGMSADSEIVSMVNQAPVEQLDNGYFRGLKSDAGQALVVGDMTSRISNDKKAVFVVAVDDYRDLDAKSSNIVFKCDCRAVVAYGKDGKVPVNYDAETGVYSIAIRSNEGILIEAI
ncbi:MAG: hypothetical protein E7588_07950 [Ruminococcaceae bacterium]|nr:hypothetical protein [Oscillospiraceae bacterium]